ncbi:MAG: type II toxin-antitoxin system HipA family toxin [Acidimicrobiales bacterium]
MPSDSTPDLFVWVWLPKATEPVVAGVLSTIGSITFFTYGTSYRSRPNAIPLYLPELPIQSGQIPPLAGLRVAGCIADGGPDSWGRRVIDHRHFAAAPLDTSELHDMTYLLESGTERIGALDFQESATQYLPRTAGGTLDELMQATERLEAGEPFSEELDRALFQGSAIGGARPKALLADGQRTLIAKFSSSTDHFPVVKAEGVAMALARRVGLEVAPTEVVRCLGKDVLLIERFDRTAVLGERRMMVSALTMLELDETMGRYANYPDLADIIRGRFDNPKATLRELFSRIVFNICVGNTDDHARNHAAFWDGDSLTLTPAYDICPQGRSGGGAVQAMAIGRDGSRLSQLTTCVAASTEYLLTKREAREIIDYQLHTIETQWDDAAEEALLSIADVAQLKGRQILNPYALEGYAEHTF